MARYSLDLQSLRSGFLCLAVAIYALFGSPTPDDPGVLGVVIAGLLILAVGVSGAWMVVAFERREIWVRAAQIFLLFGLSVPLLGGILTGNDPGLLLRDVIPFLFMMLPLFLFPLIEKNDERFLLFSVLGLGVLFALRAGFELPFLGKGEELYYLANMPSVLFAAVFCAGLAAADFVQRFSVKASVKALMLCGVAALCLWPMIETQQRASLGVFVLSLAFVLAVYGMKYPHRIFIIVLALACVGGVFISEILDVFENLNRKTELVGVNMRAAEWAAVWDEISAHPLSVFFGQGWGATFSSPAVADIDVNFTHGLLSSLLLKTGLIGLALGLVYLSTLGRMLISGFKTQPVLAVAIAGPVLIDVFLYASFKSLDFGLVLALIPMLCLRIKS